MIYFGNSSKIGICFYNNSCIKKSDIENLKILFLIHGLLKYISEKEKREGQIQPHPIGFMRHSI